jgi:hypothetical protein
MKKVFTLIAALVMAAAVNAQSIQWHQSYSGNQKLVADIFWSNDNFNVYSYNEFTVTDNQAVGYGIVYGEWRIAGSHLLLHAEGRMKTRSFPDSLVPTAMYWPSGSHANAGLAYEICAGEHLVFSPTMMWRYDFGAGHNWQFSINSSGDWDDFYYEGYVDTWGPDGFNLCTEQKVYCKLTPMFHLGMNLMLFNVASAPAGLSMWGDGRWNVQPWIVARVAF